GNATCPSACTGASRPSWTRSAQPGTRSAPRPDASPRSPATLGSCAHWLKSEVRTTGITAQHHPCPAQLRLQLGQGALDLPTLVVERGQFRGGRLRRGQDGGQQPIQRLRPRDAPPPAV